MLQRLPLALAQVKTRKISNNILNEIRQIIYALCCAKEITVKVFNSIMNSIKLQNRMDTIFMNSYDPYRLLLNLLDKINLKRSDIYAKMCCFIKS